MPFIICGGNLFNKEGTTVRSLLAGRRSVHLDSPRGNVNYIMNETVSGRQYH